MKLSDDRQNKNRKDYMRHIYRFAVYGLSLYVLIRIIAVLPGISGVSRMEWPVKSALILVIYGVIRVFFKVLFKKYL